MNSDTKINYLERKDKKYLPWQYYNIFKLISIPIVPKSKIPFIKGWNLKTETVRPTYINQNTALLCGPANGITVLDIDGDRAKSVYNELCVHHKPFKSPKVITPSGGIHVYFKYEKDLKSSLGLNYNGEKMNWDLKNNGLVIAPPSSMFVDGKLKRYKWAKGMSLDDIKISKMPVWLKKFIKNHQV